MQQGKDRVLKIETERLELHKISGNHRVWFFELLSNPELLRYISDAPSQEEIEMQFQSRLKPWNLEPQHWLTLSVFEKRNGKFVGLNGFKYQQGCASVGFIFLPSYQGFGYATESLNAVCELAENLGIREMEAKITEGNSASVKVVEKCGFVLSNNSSGTIKIGGKIYNDLEYKKVLNKNT